MKLAPILLDLRLLFGVLLLTRLAAYVIFPVYDDAFISFRYANQIAAGFGLVYNPHEAVNGTTTPLFALFGAALRLVALPLPVVIPLINIGLELGLVLVASRLVYAGSFNQSAGFILLLAMAPILGRVTVGGMESVSFMLITLLVFNLYQRDRVLAAAALAAVSYFLRPESVVSLAVLMLLEIRRPRRALALGLVGLAVLVPVLARFELAYGHALPQSILAKRHLIRETPIAVLLQLLAPEPLAGLVAMLGLAGAGMALSRPGIGRGLALWLLLYLMAYAAAGPKIWSWYAYPPLFLCALLAPQLLPPVRSWMPALAAVGVLLLWGGLLLWKGPDRISAGVYAGIRQWCATIPPDSTVMAEDIGVLGWYCPAVRVLDANGLVWPPALDYHSFAAMIAATRPDYVLVNADRDAMIPLQEQGFGALYRPVRRFARDGNPDPAAMPPLQAEWLQEYVVFARK